MELSLGVMLAFLAMLCWGFGDFLIQKSTRKFGDWETLFFISLFGTIIILPFIYKDLNVLLSFSKQLIILLAASFVILFAALFDFEALKRGKLSVVEPIYSLEIPIAAFLAYFILKESLAYYQIILIISLVVGLFLVSLKTRHFEKKNWLEKGVLFVVFGTIFMGASNFLVGLGARETSALIVNWVMSVFLTSVSFIYIISTKNLFKIKKEILSNKKLLLGMCFLDNAAWIAFAFAMTLAPIAIAVSLSESYIIIAVLLGMYINKEYIRSHQKVGLVLAVISAILLALTI